MFWHFDISDIKISFTIYSSICTDTQDSLIFGGFKLVDKVITERIRLN